MEARNNGDGTVIAAMYLDELAAILGVIGMEIPAQDKFTIDSDVMAAHLSRVIDEVRDARDLRRLVGRFLQQESPVFRERI